MQGDGVLSKSGSETPLSSDAVHLAQCNIAHRVHFINRSQAAVGSERLNATQAKRTTTATDARC